MFCYFVIAFLILISSSHFSSFNVQLILSLLISVFFFICQFTVHLLYKFCTDLYKSWMFSRVSIVNRTNSKWELWVFPCFVLFFYKVSVMIELLWITQVTSFVCFCCSLSSFWLCFLFLFFISLVGLSKEARGSLTSLLVQPISALLAKTLLSSPSTGQEGSCIPLAMPPNTGKHTDYRKPELLIMSHSTESVFKSMRVFFF